VGGCWIGLCILLSLLWSLVVDKLIRRLSVNGCYTWFADDVAILIIGRFANTSELQETLSMVQQWCDKTWFSQHLLADQSPF
jgi:hypothetical protein